MGPEIWLLSLFVGLGVGTLGGYALGRRLARSKVVDPSMSLDLELN